MDSFVGEVRIFGFKFAPEDWALCDGQKVSIGQYQALYAVIGITFGGDGKSYFNLPNLQGLAVMGAGTGPNLTPRVLGKVTGTPAVTLTAAQMAAHNHPLNAAMEVPPASSEKMTAAPAADTYIDRKMRKMPDGKLTMSKSYSADGSGAQGVTLHPSTIGAGGANTPHENRQPYLAMNYCISLNGEFPPPPQ